MKYSINLIGKKEMNLIDKTLYFFLNYLRYILVITQLVVIAVLFYRFKIDQSIIDLKDSLDQKREIVNVVKPLLSEAKKINTQMNAVKKITLEQSNHLKSIEYVLSIFPNDLFLTQFQYADETLSLKGNAYNPQHLQLFYRRLTSERKFKTVDLTNIKRDETGYIFTLTLSDFK